jgi:CHAT domain-containing protein
MTVGDENGVGAAAWAPMGERYRAFRLALRRGANWEAAAIADALPAELRARPGVALGRTVARMRQGRMKLAGAALAEASAGGSAGERLLVALQWAILRIFCENAVGRAVADAAAAMAAAGETIDAAERAEAERVHITILLIAAALFEVDREEGRRARERLAGVAEALESAGWLEEGMAARLSWAERTEDAAARDAAFEAVEAHGIGYGLPGVAAAARLGLAEARLAAGADRASIDAELDAAAALYAQAEHVEGPIDVERLRARLAAQRNMAKLDRLEACLAAYRRIDSPRGMFKVLADLSQLAHERGDAAAAAEYRRELEELGGEAGLEMARDGARLAKMDLLMRANQYTEAIDLGRAALAASPPRFRVASYEQLTGTAYSFVGDHEAAVRHWRQALAGFEQVGAEASASIAAQQVATQLVSAAHVEEVEEGEQLLRSYAAKDRERGDLAAWIGKVETLVLGRIQRFLQPAPAGRDLALLAGAAHEVGEARGVAQELPAPEGPRRQGNLFMLDAQLCQARGDEAAAEEAERAAFALFESAGLAMEAANCRYLIGVMRLNLANVDPLAHFGEAEGQLNSALDYYGASGMRSQAADARWMLARLYANAEPRVPEQFGEQLHAASLGHLQAAEADYDAIRREYRVGSVIDAQRGKREVAGKSRRIYELALELTLGRPAAAAAAWSWLQRGKARSLLDALGSGSTVPARVLAQLEQHPDSLADVHAERDLAARVQAAPDAEVPGLRAQLAELQARMAQDPWLSDYLALRTGAAIELGEVTALLSGAETRRQWVCLDWLIHGDRVLVAAVRAGRPPEIVPVALSAGTVRAWIRQNLDEGRFRGTLRDAPEVLRELDALVAPLGHLSAPEELLILAPSGPLYALPLHALEVGGEVLLVRNPVVYTPSLGVLRQCLARRISRRGNAGGPRSAALFGDPNGDRREASEMVAHLAALFGTTPRLGSAVTKATFEAEVAGCEVVHFQGHARYDPDDALQSRLVLADGALTAREVFDLPGLTAELMTLAACESAANAIGSGDEPSGLIPAFLYAGAGAVLASLWQVQDRAAARTMQAFYDAMMAAAGTADKAESLRQAMLALRAAERWESPYFWAPFVLYGDWR